ncbi:MAG: M23 family metallopeptidase [Clostridia bacterium]|nr:M23 family metallopeptidase [Clostridia bacterium]
MREKKQIYRVSDVPAELLAARVAKAELLGVKEEKAGRNADLSFGKGEKTLFTRADGVLAALFCICAMGLGFLAAYPIGAAGNGELDGAVRGVSRVIAESKLLGDIAPAVAANAEPADPSGQLPEVEISYIGASSAAEYIAAPPESAPEKLFGIMPAFGTVISGFSYRDNPLYGFGESARFEFHKGIDIPLVKGTELVAFADGTVCEAGESDSYGIYLIIDHGGGYKSLYAHMSKIVRGTGAVVKQGDVVGLSGDSGRVTGAHLHFELHKDGVPVDPEDYIK